MKSTHSLFVMVALVLVGCGTNPEPTSVVCTDFRAGADMSQSTFGVTGELEKPYGAFAQAAGDLAAVANETLRNVGDACHGLATELGADPNDPRVRGLLAPDAVRAWCKIAAERFELVRPRLAAAHFAVQIITPKCTVDTSFQVDCEQRCATSAACKETSPLERCPVDAREGICNGACTGTCTGSEEAPATCDGKCEGSCFGTCGEDDKAADCGTGCACTTTCHGTCTAACSPAAGAAARCDAVCSGTCSEPMLAETCTAPLAPPKCGGDVDCSTSCSASGAARAACPGGSLSVIVDAGARDDRELLQITGALERNLPAIFLAARGRAQLLSDGASSLVDVAGHILARSEELGAMGAACGLLIGQTSLEAKKSLSAALGGSKDVAHAVSGDTAAHAPTNDE